MNLFNNQKGVIPILAIIVGLLILGYLIGNYTVYHPTAIKVSPTPTSIPTSLPKPNVILTTPSPTPFPPPTSSSTPSPQSTSTPQPSVVSLPSPTPIPMITAAGRYSYLGQYITYNFTFPQEGGDVSGSVSGICNGSVSGKFDGRDGGSTSGTIPVSCHVGLFTQDYQINYNGKVYLIDKRVDLNWTSDIPFLPPSGSLSLYF